ncbi:hypothetical protein M9978_15835 [Sphingomonas sp. MG17]|uniref:Uncharacterized protein n=1 Tax=Sphingomonas tagetis TaxID=2949092 RepID=A0A9X2HIN0_9SPHN|nr:hypothetical protein [Sphingomonas tagetis]MCP3731896.1 hypothetical protein [Sphingomonas tagetis]
MHGLPKSAVGRWLIGGTLVFLAVLALVLSFLGDDPEPGGRGQVEIVGAAPVPQPMPGASTASTAKMAPIPVAPSNSNALTAGAQAARLIDEKRDRGWAPRSEAAIRQFIMRIPYLGGERYIGVKCAATACEVTGIADPDKASGTFKPVWEAIERDTAGPELRQHGLERTAAVFDTGRSGDEFKLYYRRVAGP